MKHIRTIIEKNGPKYSKTAWCCSPSFHAAVVDCMPLVMLYAMGSAAIGQANGGRAGIVCPGCAVG